MQKTKVFHDYSFEVCARHVFSPRLKELTYIISFSGLLCRDISPDGFRFYINLFNEIDPGTIYL